MEAMSILIFFLFFKNIYPLVSLDGGKFKGFICTMCICCSHYGFINKQQQWISLRRKREREWKSNRTSWGYNHEEWDEKERERKRRKAFYAHRITNRPTIQQTTSNYYRLHTCMYSKHFEDLLHAYYFENIFFWLQISTLSLFNNNNNNHNDDDDDHNNNNCNKKWWPSLRFNNNNTSISDGLINKWFSLIAIWLLNSFFWIEHF